MSSHAFKLLEIAAAGTFGTVCVAQDLNRGTLVALKVLKSAHLSRPRVIARTKDEATMMSRLHHPGIVVVNGLLMIDDRPLLSMEWIRGLSIEELLPFVPRGFSAPVAVEIVRQSTQALGAAYHATSPGSDQPMHIIHRDVKPSNLLLTVNGVVKVVDFGIARAEFDEKEAQTMSMVLGARGYLAPERLDGQDDQPSCDIYGLGIVLYELISGRHIVLSVHREFHHDALTKHLKALEGHGVSKGAIEALKPIISDMCAYEADLRPDHQTVVKALSAWAEEFQAPADMAAVGREIVLPAFLKRPQVRPIDHPAYPDLAFVERHRRAVTYPAPPDVDQEIRVFLRDDDWLSRLDELDFLLQTNPHWSPAPILERLPSGSRSWWKFWGGTAMSAAGIVALLSRLKSRLTPQVQERAKQLSNHQDEAVATLCREIVAIDAKAVT